jgi:DNA-methyltransferase (dcm)
MSITIKYFDLFAGIGGFRCAAENINNKKIKFKHVAFCEIDECAQMFYEKACNMSSVTKINDARDIKTKKNEKGIKVPKFDMLFAGFPCQSFSNVGYRKGLADERGQLFFNILDILDFYNPKYFVLENVQKLSTIECGNLLDEMKIALQEIGIGYNLHVWDLMASDYGLPQKRNRIFFCGIRKDVANKKEISEPPCIDLSKSKYPTAWHLLEKSSVDEKHYIPQKTRKTVLYKNPNWEGDVNIDNPIARPLTATMAKWHRANQDNYFSETYIRSENPYLRPEVNLDVERIRRITPLEGFRIQGFPDRFVDIATELKISYSAQYRLIGNAVPVDLAQAVIEHFINNYIV